MCTVRREILKILEKSTDNFSKISKTSTEKVFTLKKVEGPSLKSAFEYPHSSGKYFNITSVQPGIPALKYNDFFANFGLSSFNKLPLKSNIDAKINNYIELTSHTSNSYLPELQVSGLPVLKELQLYRQNSFTKEKFYESFLKGQNLYDRLHFGETKTLTKKTIFDSIDKDSPNPSIGTIIQSKAEYFFTKFTEHTHIKTLPALKGTNSDFLVSTDYEVLHVDVKMLRTDIHMKEYLGLKEMWNSSNGDIFLKSSKILELLETNITKNIKNPNPVLLLTMGGYPSETCLEETKEFQFKLNNDILPKLKRLDPTINPRLSIYFSFSGSIRPNNSASIKKVVDFNLQLLKELHSVNDSYIEDITKSVLKSK